MTFVIEYLYPLAIQTSNSYFYFLFFDWYKLIESSAWKRKYDHRPWRSPNRAFKENQGTMCIVNQVEFQFTINSLKV